MPASDPRRTLGATGERLARTHLEARGLTVLDANFRTRDGELDIVAADPRCLVFCEVKTRITRATRPQLGNELGPFAAIGPRKQRKLRLLARQWLAQRGDDVPRLPELRFDAIGVELDARGRLLRIDHLEGAF
ncbi:MAG: putative endonuclease [Thermoleophilaceae bacterium]|jgi:putative endonuclease|nr:putative endonuclease [Thermoleophilaceae bacterium]